MGKNVYCPYCGKQHEVELVEQERRTRSNKFVVKYYYCKENGVYFSDKELNDYNYFALKKALCE